jgi:hypothetical protein
MLIRCTLKKFRYNWYIEKVSYMPITKWRQCPSTPAAMSLPRIWNSVSDERRSIPKWRESRQRDEIGPIRNKVATKTGRNKS